MKLSNLINEAWLTDEETKSKLTSEDKKAFVEAVSKFNDFNKSIYRENDLKEVTDAIKELCGRAKDVTLGESENWFDNITVNRHMKHLNDSVKLFEKTAKEISILQQRLESSYEDIGSTLSKYYTINEEDLDKDDDGDTDFADIMISRMVASGMSKEDAKEKVKDKEYNK